MDRQTLRAMLPIDETVAYLNTGASGPVTTRVQDAATAAIRQQAGAADPYAEAAAITDAAREQVAAFVGTPPETVAFTQSTTAAINAGILACELEPGERVLTTAIEHGAVRLPLARQRRRGVDVTTIEAPDGRVDREAYSAAVGQADLVVVSAVSWTHGTVLPVPALVEEAHDAGARVLVDAVQAVGQRPVDVRSWGADLVAFAGHKWLLAPWGAGVLVVDPDAVAALTPATVGYAGVQTDGAGYTWLPDARRFELGTRGVAPLAGLTAAIEQLTAIGIEEVARWNRARAQQLVEALEGVVAPMGHPGETGIVTLAVEAPEQTVTTLADAGFIVRSIPDLPGSLRVSMHIFTTPAEVSAFAEALTAIVTGAR
ncbi:MAG: aminotransferase class V-fold PLP-dependent enzyme [Haloquadratum sp.]|nr:aminotransferase class V-fold PLP-dependent enzyme [Haloferacaceae archaeon]MDR9445244.1 aminotransferase class V-fold PLP-dependent enzyme [Haloquadratum sp.]